MKPIRFCIPATPFSIFFIALLFTSGIRPANAQFTDMEAGLTGVGDASVAWGDYEGDGDLDLLVMGQASSGTLTRLYINNNNDFSAAEEDLPFIHVSLGDIAWGDFDNDGDDDLLLTGQKNDGVATTQLYRNNGNGTFTDLNAGIAALKAGMADWGDFDDDHKLDFFISGVGEDDVTISKIYRNTGKWSGPGAGIFEDIGANIKGLRRGDGKWVDYDRDGDLDLMLTGRDTNNTRWSILYQNNNGSFVDTWINFPDVDLSAVDWVDFDGDGYQELLLAGTTNAGLIAQIYYNPNYVPGPVVRASFDGVEFAAARWGDYNGNGSPGLALMGRNASNVPLSKIYDWNGGSSFSDIGAGLIGLYKGDLSWGDFDGDGDLDLALAGLDASDTPFARIYRKTNSFVHPYPETKLTANDGDAGDDFGISVSIYDDKALIGANGDEDKGYRSGSAYIFEMDDGVWSQKAKLTASDASENDEFGQSVSLHQDRALVGAQNADAAYIFEKQGNNWTEKAKLTALDDSPLIDNFGMSTSLVGDRALIGAIGNGQSERSAYIFEWRDGAWIQTAKLTASDGMSDDAFGISVSLSGNRAIVGASSDDDKGTISGSAYIFELQGDDWIEVAKLTASDGEAFNEFGRAVSLSGDRALIGSAINDAKGESSGAAYLFELQSNTWNQIAKLTASDGSAEDRFSFAVSLLGDRALIGAIADDDNGQSSGSAYVFERVNGEWIETEKILASDGAGHDSFGNAVSLSTGKAIIGAFGNDDNGDYSGSAYVYVIDDSPSIDPGFTDSGISIVDVDEAAAAWADYDNDNDLDLLIAGTTNNGAVTRLYRNSNNSLTDSGLNFPPIDFAALDWADYNNDGHIDFILTGRGDGETHNTLLFRNTGLGFEEESTDLPGLLAGSTDWGDFDNDGDPDLLLTGRLSNHDNFSAVFRNVGGDFENIDAGLDGVRRGQSAWVDYDVDGDLDIILTGQKDDVGTPHTVIYKNNDGNFEKITDGLPDVKLGSVDFGDYDNDGDPDLLITGKSSNDWVSQVYRNNITNFSLAASSHVVHVCNIR